MKANTEFRFDEARIVTEEIAGKSNEKITQLKEETIKKDLDGMTRPKIDEVVILRNKHFRIQRKS